MADFEPKRKSINDFNDGKKIIDGDLVHEDFLNNVVESTLFTQGLATNAPNMDDANNFGQAKASIVTASDGTAQLKFDNLKGNSIKSFVLKSQSQENGLTKNIYTVTFSDGSTQEIDMYAESGANGIDITITKQKVEYATSESGTTAPSVGWSTIMPTVAQGEFLWSRTTVTYSDGNSTVAYSKAYMGVDGDRGEPMYAHYVSVFNTATTTTEFFGTLLLFINRPTAIPTASLLKDILTTYGSAICSGTYSSNFYPVERILVQNDNWVIYNATGTKVTIPSLTILNDTVVPISQKGEKGVGIASVEKKGSRVENGNTVTTLQVIYDESEKTPDTVEILSVNGKDSTPITGVTTGTSSIVGNKTVTPVTLLTEDNAYKFEVMSTNGKDGNDGNDGSSITSITVTKVG